ncbi:MAG: trypsin-like peptidase domain-containing protein [Alphaproteobacteria bacterium]|nr:trypsin-like peptidase domain-containing protein [Alphaproteobacteria bacterium]
MNKLVKLFSCGVIISSCCLQVSAENGLLDIIKNYFTSNSNIQNNTVFNKNTFKNNNLVDIVQDIIINVFPSVVSVISTYNDRTITNEDLRNIINNYFTDNLQGSYFNIGSGFCVKLKDNKLYVVTSLNIVKNNKHVSVILDDNQLVNAKVYATDSDNNIAVLEIDIYDANINRNRIQCIKWGNSDSITREDQVFATGNICGTKRLLSSGFIMNKYNNNRKLIKHTVAINPNYIGGILVNDKKEVIGINTDASEYALTSNQAMVIIDSMIDNNNTLKGWIGIASRALPYDEAKNLGIIPSTTDRWAVQDNKSVGAIVLQVIPNSPADKAGIKPNDIIVGANNNLVNDKNPLHNLINYYDIGKTVTLTVLRENNYKIDGFECKVFIDDYDGNKALSIC